MTTLASPTNWRSGRQWSNWYAYILVPDIIFARRVNQASFAYPIAELTYDDPDGGTGVFGDVVIGQTVRIKDSSGVFKGWAEVRAAPSSTVLKINPTSIGDINFEDNDQIEVLNEFRPWAHVPRITGLGLTVTQYRNYDVVFAAGSQQPPVANDGAPYIGFLDGSDQITVDFDASESYTVREGATISSYLRNFRDYDSIVSGSTSSSSAQVKFPAGYRYVPLTVTDSSGNTHTNHKLVVGVDRDSALKVAIGQLSGDIERGWECQLQILESDVSSYPEGSTILVWADEYYSVPDAVGSLNGPSGYEHIKFYGFLTQDSSEIEPLDSTWSIAASSPLMMLENFPAFAITLQRYASPTEWGHVADLNWWRYTLDVMHWYSNILTLCEFIRPSFYDDYDLKAIDGPTGSQKAQFQQVINAVGARLTISTT